jgi:LacI family transcriptional regulator
MVVKINDVAREAMVSIATVSRVVNNIPIVNEDTRLRVEEAIKKLNYKPNAIARSLKLQKTHTIGVIAYDIAKLSSTSAVRGIEDCGSDNGYNVIIFNTFNDSGKELKAVDLAYQKQCDGVIVLGMNLSSEFTTALSDLSIPIIIAAQRSEGFPYVAISEQAAASEAASYLIGKGHKKIVLLDEAGIESSQKHEGFMQAILRSGFSEGNSCVANGPGTYEGGYDTMLSILANGDFPTAVLCANDDMACGAIRACESRSLSVPGDISVVGFYDFPISKWNNPAITTIGFDSYELGRAGMQMLINYLQNPNDPKTPLILPHSIIERNSVRSI